jgi:hypothetical protein
MKKLIFILGLFPLVNKAQVDSIYIVASKDEMTDKVYHYPNLKLVLFEPDKSKALIIEPMLDKSGKEITNLLTMVRGMGGCNEKDEMILLFDNGQKTILKSWKDFNCNGEAYFEVGKQDRELLKSSKILKIRFTNGRSFESYTKEVDEIKQSYFVKVYDAISRGDVRLKKN